MTSPAREYDKRVTAEYSNSPNLCGLNDPGIATHPSGVNSRDSTHAGERPMRAMIARPADRASSNDTSRVASSVAQNASRPAAAPPTNWTGDSDDVPTASSTSAMAPAAV